MTVLSDLLLVINTISRKTVVAYARLLLLMFIEISLGCEIENIVRYRRNLKFCRLYGNSFICLFFNKNVLTFLQVAIWN